MPVTIKKKAKPVQLTAKGKASAPVTPSERTFKRIYAMKPDQRNAMDSLFYEGKSVSAIIDVLRNGMGLFTDVSDHGLSKYLYRYKWEVIEKNLVAPKVVKNADKFGITPAMIANAKSQIEPLEEVAQLVVAQKARVAKLLTRETTMPMLFNQLGSEMKTLAGFLQQFSDLSFDLGVLKRVPKITKITQGEDGTILESDGREQFEYSVEQTERVEKAAAEFFKVLEGEGPTDASVQSL